MAEALILDAEALNALANAAKRRVLADRAHAVLGVAYEKGALVRVPAPVLAEVYRGPRFDAAVDYLLRDRGIVVCELTASIAKRAGHLLAAAGRSSEHAIDAFVVATALEFKTALIATGDPKDLQRLAAPYKRVKVFAV